MNDYFIASCKKFVQQQIADKNILINYLRDNDNNPYGVVVAVKTGDSFNVGASVCNTKKDSFNRYVGVYIAAQRALKANSVLNGDNIFRSLCKLSSRASKYWRRPVPTFLVENLVSSV